MYVHVYRAGIKLATFRLKTHYCLSPSRNIPTWNKEWSRKTTKTGTCLHSGNMVTMLTSGSAKSHFFSSHFNAHRQLKLGKFVFITL